MASTSELSNNSKSQSIVTKVLDATPDSNSTSSSASQDLSKQQQQQKTTTTSPINFEEAEAVAAQSLLQAAYSINLSHRSDRNGPSNPSTTAVSTSVLNGNRLVASSSASSTGDINVVSSFNKFGGYSYSKGSPIPAVQSSTSAENSDVQAGKKRGGNDSDEKGKGKEKKARKSVADDVEEDEEEDDMVGSEEGSQSKITSSKRAAQNRLAQKNFREKKEDYIKELEAKAKQLEKILSQSASQQSYDIPGSNSSDAAIPPLPYPSASSTSIPIPLASAKPIQSLLLPVIGSHILSHTKEELESSWLEEKRTLLLQREIERQGFVREKLMWMEVIRGLKVELEELRDASRKDSSGRGESGGERL